MSKETQKGIDKTVTNEMENLNPGDYRTLTVLTGTVTEPEREYRKPLVLNGTLVAPFDFYRHRKTRHGKHLEKVAHLIIDKEHGTMQLVLDEEDVKSQPKTIVNGRLEANPDLEAMDINTNTTYSAKEMMQHLKFNRAMFHDRGRCTELVGQLMNFTVDVEKQIKNHDDLKGNVLISIEQKVKQQFNLDFDVACPIFKGTPTKVFKVTVNVTVTSTGCDFWIESVDLKELEMKARNEAIDEQVALFNDEIVVIEATSSSSK